MTGTTKSRSYDMSKDLPGVPEGRVVQESLTHLVINIVPSARYGGSEGDLIRTRVAMSYGLGSEVKIEVRRLEQIPRKRSGKFRSVVSRRSGQQAAQGAISASNSLQCKRVNVERVVQK